MESALVVSAPMTVPPSETQSVVSSAPAEVKPTARPSEHAVEPSPAAGYGSMVLVPTGSSRWVDPTALNSAPAGRPSLDVDLRQSFAFIETQASSLEGTARSVDPPFLDLAAPKPPIDEVAEAQAPAEPPSSAPPRAAPPEPGPDSGGQPTATPYPVFPQGEARKSKRTPTLSAFAKDVQLLSNVIPPMQPPKPALGEDNAANPGGQQPWESSRTAFQAPTEWLSRPLSPSADASPTGPAAKPESKSAEPSTEGDDQKARTAERNLQFWRRLAKTQAASKPLDEQQPEAEKPSELLRAIRQFVRGAPETPEQRAYASLLGEGVHGPMRLRIADRATLWLPFGYVFLDAEKARDLLDGEEGVLDENNFGVILPSTRSPTWIAYVDVVDQGHIKDDDAKMLAPATLLAGLAAASSAQNIERGRNGMAPLTVGDWITAPKYLPSKHMLNSCVSVIDGAGLDPQSRLANCASLALGRRGAIKILLVGAMPNLVSFEKEAAALAEKIAYDSSAGYEGYVPGEDEDSGYGLVSLASGVVGLKTIATPVAAAGAGKAQDLLLYKIVSYWEAILTALIAAALGAYWFFRGRPREQEDSEASRQAVHMPFWKAALWAARRGLRRLIEKRAQPTRAVEARVEPIEKPMRSQFTPARSKPGRAAWKEKLVSILSFLRSRASGPSERDAACAAETSAARESSEDADVGQGKLPARARTRPISASPRAPAKPDAAPGSAPGPADAAPQTSAMDSVAAKADDLNRLASLMRRKDKLSAPSEDASARSPRPNVLAARSAEPSVKVEEDKSGATKKGALDLFDLVEPGDAQAVSMAAAAHEALQRAQG